MSAFASERETLETHFLPLLEARFTPATVEKDNVPFEPPVNLPWARFTIEDGETDEAALGGEQLRTPGLLVVDAFFPRGTGTGEGRALADWAAPHLQLRRFACGATSWLQTRALRYRRLPDEGDWHRAKITVPFHRDDFDGTSA